MVPESGTSNKQNLGPQMLTLGRRGRITIQITVDGISAHPAEPEKGVSALHRAALIICGLQKAVKDGKIAHIIHPQLTGGSFSIRSIKSDAKSLSISDKATFLIDRHLVPEESSQTALNKIVGVVESMKQDGQLDDRPVLVSLKERQNPHLMPYVTSSQHTFVQHTED